MNKPQSTDDDPQDENIDEPRDIKIIADLSFRAADKFFKFASWLVFLAAIKFAHLGSNVKAVAWLDLIASSVFSLALIAQIIYLTVRSPAHWDIPKKFHPLFRVFQFSAALVLGFFVVSPDLYLDQIIEGLMQAKCK